MFDVMEEPMYVDYPLRGAEDTRQRMPRGWSSTLDPVDVMGATRTAACVLLTGGRRAARAVAERIHLESGWSWGPFQVVDCAAGDAALESLLFTPLERDLWPVESDAPVLRLLQPGTMLLQEVGHLSPRAQAHLRDLLELGACERHGRRSRRRIMASTPEPLLGRVMEGSFDETLFYRLNAIHFVV
jgi:DNA-binding NtrC family response regulator